MLVEALSAYAISVLDRCPEGVQPDACETGASSALGMLQMSAQPRAAVSSRGLPRHGSVEPSTTPELPPVYKLPGLLWSVDRTLHQVRSLGVLERWRADIAQYPDEGLFYYQEAANRVLVYPEKKLAFCFMEKNACTTFNKLFNRLNHRDVNDSQPFYQSLAAGFGLSIEDLTAERGWKWAVFLHNPFDRYLAAFRSKCARPAPDQMPEESGENCMPPHTVYNLSRKDFEAQVDSNYYHHLDLLHLNPHWARQQDFCGGLRNARGYDFVGQLSGNVNAQVRQMLRMVGGPEEVVDELFPRDGTHIDHLWNESADSAHYYRKASTRSKVMQMYLPDFDLPGMPEVLSLAS